MRTIRISLVAVVASLALAAVGVPTAGATTNNGGVPAATDAGPLYTLPMTGVAKNGKRFTGTYGIYKFVVKDGKVWSVGTLSGKLKGRHVKRGNVMMPATLTGDSNTATTSQAGSCTVLHLVLGPINLNLLGLKVTLGGGLQANQPIVLDITAQRGGGLLGDLLCGLTDTLGGQLGQLATQLQNLASTLNSLISLLGGLQATQP
jgi:hypothetical protein